MRENFNYGCSEDELLLKGVKVWPQEGDMTALLDADFIPYNVGFCIDPVKYHIAIASGDLYKHRYWKEAVSHASFLINDCIEKAGCDSAILYVTDSENNFRNEIATTRSYKEDREGKDKPPFFHELKQWLVDFHGAVVSDNCEADDEISIEAWKRHLDLKHEGIQLWGSMHQKWSDFVIVSKDKDLNIIPGWHLDFVTKEVHWVDKIGYLTPVTKEKEVAKYEYWPIFEGKPVNINRCSYVGYDSDGELRPLEYSDHSAYEGDFKKILDDIWYFAKNGTPITQDKFSRGNKKGQGKFKRMKVGTMVVDAIVRLKGAGLKFFYSQILTGDTADCYGGLQGAGASTAYNALEGCVTEKEMHDVVLAMYKDKHRHRAEDKMREQGRLAWMQTYKGELWDLLGESRRKSFQI